MHTMQSEWWFTTGTLTTVQSGPSVVMTSIIQELEMKEVKAHHKNESNKTGSGYPRERYYGSFSQSPVENETTNVEFYISDSDLGSLGEKNSQ